MLFDSKQFEQFFKERVLRKGLKLFEKGNVELVEKPSGIEYFFIIADAQLYLKKKGDKLISYTCSCASDSFCEHLGAALFYFQQEALGISSNKNGTSGIGSASLALTRKKFKRDIINGLENQALVNFIKNNAKEIDQITLKRFFADKITITEYDLLCLQINAKLKSAFQSVKLGQKEIDKVYEKLSGIILHKKVKAENYFFVHLAVATELAMLLNLRFIEDEKKLRDLYQLVLRKLDLYFLEGLNELEREALFSATIQSVKVNSHLSSGLFNFLVPRFVSVSKSKTQLEQLRVMLDARKYKVPYSHHFNKLLIAQLQVALREWKLFKLPFPFKNYEEEVEFTISESELYFCEGKNDKAFAKLESGFENVLHKNKKYLTDYLEYIITKAREKNRPDIEIKYLKESFIYGLHISPVWLDRFMELVSAVDKDPEIDQLITRIKNSRNHSFEKLSTLFLRTNRLDDLLLEIKKQSNKFTLVHKIALLKLPGYNDMLLALYMKHLMEAYDNNRVYNYQEQLFVTAKTYIHQLPSQVASDIVSKILERLGGQSRIHKFIENLFLERMT